MTDEGSGIFFLFVAVSIFSSFHHCASSVHPSSLPPPPLFLTSHTTNHPRPIAPGNLATIARFHQHKRGGREGGKGEKYGGRSRVVVSQFWARLLAKKVKTDVEQRHRFLAISVAQKRQLFFDLFVDTCGNGNYRPKLCWNHMGDPVSYTVQRAQTGYGRRQGKTAN